MKLFAADALPPESPEHLGRTLTVANDIDPRSLDLNGVVRVDLQFPQFTDGRAFSQAFLLRRRLGFAGDIRATGEVLVDQLQQMQRTGFTEAVLAPGQDLALGLRLLALFSEHYQGDAVQPLPRFARLATPAQEAA
jgi:uncharacterized protein (DUF934 family)